MSEEEIYEKFNEVLNDPDHKFLIDDIKRYVLVQAYGNIGGENIMEEAERKDKRESLEDVVNLPQKSQEKIKDMSLEEILEYDDLEDLLDELY